MPKLLDVQRAVHRGLLDPESGAAATLVVDDGLAPSDRLAIYRNTMISVLANALRLSYPAVERLVGTEFFEGAAHFFLSERLPKSAYLNDYGGDFPEFLGGFAPAASLPYLVDVARIEWAVNRALHAPDVAPLDKVRLAAIDPADHGLIRLQAQPSLTLLRVTFPADVIWRAVLDHDDDTLAAIDLHDGGVALLVERGPAGVVVSRLEPSAWHFLSDLCSGEALQVALNRATDIDPGLELAEHFAVGRFIAFSLENMVSTFAKAGP